MRLLPGSRAVTTTHKAELFAGHSTNTTGEDRTMYKSISLALLVLAATSPGAVSASSSVDVPEVSGPPITIQLGEERKSRRLLNGQEIIQTTRLIDANTIEWSSSDGCTTTASTKDIYAPNLTWDNCGPAPWGTGKAVDMKIKGGLWPLKVGNVVHYQFKVVNSAGGSNPRAFRSCEVTEKLMTRGSRQAVSRLQDAMFRAQRQAHVLLRPVGRANRPLGTQPRPQRLACHGVRRAAAVRVLI
jgi:hypothetical protein